MGLVDVAVGTVASGYLALRLMNRALERVFFVQGGNNKVVSADEVRMHLRH